MNCRPGSGQIDRIRYALMECLGCVDDTDRLGYRLEVLRAALRRHDDLLEAVRFGSSLRLHGLSPGHAEDQPCDGNRTRAGQTIPIPCGHVPIPEGTGPV